MTSEQTNPETRQHYLDLNNKARIEKIRHAGQALRALVEILHSTGEDQYCNAADVAGFISGELLNTVNEMEVAP